MLEKDSSSLKSSAAASCLVVLSAGTDDDRAGSQDRHREKCVQSVREMLGSLENVSLLLLTVSADAKLYHEAQLFAEAATRGPSASVVIQKRVIPEELGSHLAIILRCKLGLKWESTGGDGWFNIGSKRPDALNKELVNDRLAQQLLHGKTNFNPEEWLMFGVGTLHADNYIRSGTEYFKPTALG
jgi:hypothetical protein